MQCPQCNGQCYRDEVDIGVGVQYGPWRCEECGWYQGHEEDTADFDEDFDDDEDDLPL